MRSSSLAGVLLLVACLPAASRAQDPATFYDDNCATCHTIGGGVLGGPDLKGVTARRDRERLIRFLLDPDAFASDPLRIQMIKEADGLAMGPTEGLTRELAEQILRHIEQQSGDGAPSPPSEAFLPFTPEESGRGRALFEGRTPLAAGGAPCVACHNGGDLPAFAGGRLAPDLADVHQRLGGGKGVTAWLGATQTPMMRSLYRDARLTADEARALAAFLEMAPGAAPVRRAGFPHVLGGLTGGLLVLALIGGAGYHRFRSVRGPMVDAARRQARTIAGRHTLGGLR
jgi:mono/diheme cytochrome c family protein